MQFNPNQTLKIRRSVKYLFFGFVYSILLSFMFAFACLHAITNGELLTKGGLSTTFLTVFFGGYAYLSVRRLWNADKPVVFIGPDGFLDERVFDKVIPWDVLEEIHLEKIGFFGLLRLGSKERLHILPKGLFWLRPWLRSGVRAKFWLRVNGLAIESDELSFLVAQYWKVWGAPVADRH